MVSGVGVSLSPGGELFWVFGRLHVVMVRVVLSLPWIPGISGFLRNSMALQVGFDSLELLNDILERVVVSRRDVGIRKWTSWLREDLGSRPYAWLRFDFVPSFPFLVVRNFQSKSSRILVEPHFIDA